MAILIETYRFFFILAKKVHCWHEKCKSRLRNFKREKTVQNQVNGLKIPINNDIDYFKKDNFSDITSDNIGIQLVRFNDENKRTSSVKVSMAPFLVPLSRAIPIFD